MAPPLVIALERTEMKSAYDLKALTSMGIDPATLNAVMLDLEPKQFSGLSDIIDSEWWVSKVQTSWHLTLKYGLLLTYLSQNPLTIDNMIAEVLEGWVWPSEVLTDHLRVFSPKGAPYDCIVAGQTRAQSHLTDAFSRLSLLPHLDLYAEYTPHVTLAYTKREYTGYAVEALCKHFGTRSDDLLLRFTPISIDWKLVK